MKSTAGLSFVFVLTIPPTHSPTTQKYKDDSKQGFRRNRVGREGK